MEKNKLQEILKLHLMWLRNEDGGIRADLRSAKLSYADLSSADLSYADLRYANLRYAENIYWLKRMLASRRRVLNYLGYELKTKYFYAFKTFNSQYTSPKKWKIKEKSIIKEHVDMDIFNDCSRGINVGTLKWVKNNSRGQIWKVKIKFDAEICIPIYSDGKIRVSECQLIKKI